MKNLIITSIILLQTVLGYTQTGYNTLLNNTTGGNLIAFGPRALPGISSTYQNVKVVSTSYQDAKDRLNRIIKCNNTAIGGDLIPFSSGPQNTSVGPNAIIYNTSIGEKAMLKTYHYKSHYPHKKK